MRLFSRSRLLPALVLLIGANAWSAATVFNVLDYGAHNDGSDACYGSDSLRNSGGQAAGGGTVLLPAPANMSRGRLNW